MTKKQQGTTKKSKPKGKSKGTGKLRKFAVVMKVGEHHTEEQIEAICEFVRAGASGKGKWVDKFAWAWHDNDLYIEGDEIPEGKALGDVKTKHMHLGFSLVEAGKTFSWVGNKLGISAGLVQPIDSYHFAGYLAYLTHENRPNKWQYDRSIVTTNVEDWEAKVDRQLASGKVKRLNLDVDVIVEKILTGEITESQLIGDHELAVMHVHNKVKLDNALKKRVRQLQKKQMNGEREMEVMYLCGASSTGKTAAARWFARRQGKDLFVAGAKNDLLDSYAGEQWVVLDDVRGGNFEYSEFLKMTDNNTGSSIKSRFYNKVLMAETVAITNSNPLHEFVDAMKDSDGENHKQVFRRIKTYVSLTVDAYRIYSYKEELVGVSGQEGQLFELAKDGSKVWLPYEFQGVMANEGLKAVQIKPTDSMAKMLLGFSSAKDVTLENLI